jgi:signal transduction histidine kinase
VHTAGDGREALSVLESKNVDLIVCDVMMPTMDSYQLHQAVRSRGEMAHIPFVFLTALGDAVDVSYGKELGADDYLVKPFNPKDLLAVVKGKVARSKTLQTVAQQRFEAYRKRVVHVLSHEFRTPLVAINTGAEILIDHKDKLDSSKISTLLDAIQRGGRRLERIVSDFMVLQQIEAGISQRMFDTRSVVANLNSITAQFVDTVKEDLEGEGFQLFFSPNEAECWVQVYEPHVFDILERLVSNARKFKSRELVIELKVQKQESQGVIQVSDRGIGMDVSKIQEAIDLFGQLDRDKFEQQGGGVGLAIASRYAKINRGVLKFESSPEQGTTVYLALPLHQEKA